MSRGMGVWARAFSSETSSGEQQECSIGGSRGVGAEGRSDVGGSGSSEQADDEITAGSEGLRDRAAAHLRAILIEGDVADVMQAILDPPVTTGQREECPSIGLVRSEAGDVEANVDLGRDDLPATDDEAVALDATDLTEMGPGRPMCAGAANVGILLGVSQRPEHAHLTTTVAHLWRGVDEPTEAPASLGELTLEPDWRGRHPRWYARWQTMDPHPGGKALLRHRRAARAGCCRSARGSRHGR